MTGAAALHSASAAFRVPLPLIPRSALPGSRLDPPAHGQLPCPLAGGCISNTPSQPVVSGSGSASSSCFCFSVCFHLPKCVFFCAPSVSYINTSALCSCFSVFCFLSSPVQCSSVPWYPLGCYPGYLAVPLVCFGSYLAVPTHAGRWQSKRAVTSLLEALFNEVSGSNCSDCGTVNTGIAHRKVLDRRSKPGPRDGADLACMGEEMGPSGCPHPLPLGWLL